MKHRKNFRVNLHIILIAAIVLIAVVAVYRLYRWNKGTPLDTDTSDVDPSEFDVETLDMILPMDASLLAGREDDGVTTILCLGNNPFSDDRGDTGLASQIASKPGLTYMTALSRTPLQPVNTPCTTPNIPKTILTFIMWWNVSATMNLPLFLLSLQTKPTPDMRNPSR